MSTASVPFLTEPSNTSTSDNASDIIVLKFGSSILTHEREVWSVVSEIRRVRQQGKRVVAVVSAMWGVTDRLLAAARKVTESLSGPSLARLLATGEHASVALIGLAMQEAGIEHAVLDARALGLVSDGPHTDAVPVSVNISALRSALAERGVVIVPGYEAVSRQGEPTVLGRGGSDLTAVFLADALDAEVRLIKDVDGVFERDPLRAYTPGTPRPKRYRSVRWELVPAIASRLVQAKAIEFAAAKGLPVQVCSLGSDEGTLICDQTDLGEVFAPGEGAEGAVVLAPARVRA